MGTREHSTASPERELVAYELLWWREDMTEAEMARMTTLAGRLPSDALRDSDGDLRDRVVARIAEARRRVAFDAIVMGAPDWPSSLLDARSPSPVLCARGSADLMSAPSVSIVGARHASPEALELARRAAVGLVDAGFAIFTGASVGIGLAATGAASERGGRVACAIGAPIDGRFPRDVDLIERIVANGGLAVSQVPIFRAAERSHAERRRWFPARDELMAAVSGATLVIGATDRDGATTVATACADQGRPLLVASGLPEDGSLPGLLERIGRERVRLVGSVDEIVSSALGLRLRETDRS